MNRFLECKVLGIEPKLPPIDDNSLYLLEMLVDLGFGNIKEKHIEPLSYKDIYYYLTLINLDLEYREIKAIHTLSREFCIVFNEAKDKQYKPPFSL